MDGGNNDPADSLLPQTHSVLICLICRDVLLDSQCMDLCPPGLQDDVPKHPRGDEEASITAQDFLQQQQQQQQRGFQGGESSMVQRRLGPRQLDPLQLCIEARCPKAGDEQEYGNCIFHKCILGFRLGEEEDDEEEEERMRIQMKRSGGEREGSMVDNAAAANDVMSADPRRMAHNARNDPDHYPANPDTMDNAVYTMRLQGIRRRSGPSSELSKRSWNDLAGTCLEFHCPGKVAGSLAYSICAQSKCANFIR